jgi:hypothetical protein
MAEQHAPTIHADPSDMEAHRATYRGFVRGGVAIAIHCAYILVALVSVKWGSTLPVFLAFAGIVLGALFLLIDLRSGARAFLLSLGGLVVFALITAINIT